MTSFWKDKRVFVTGHTGFKGVWLCHLLHSLGAKLGGYSLAPNTDPNMFTLTSLEGLMDHHIGDLRDFASLKKCLEDFNPDIVFHLAAQPLVRASYKDPIETYEVNVLGTLHVLEALRLINRPTTIINVTTDKCYHNKEWDYPYRENDALGGYDPYSNSKACSELVTLCYNDSFFKQTLGTQNRIALASARAGNVIGGGDWAEDRLVPDCVRAVMQDQTVTVRSPHAVRPWQHVLDPLSGYVLLAQKVHENPQAYIGSWNFGPSHLDFKTVSWVVEKTVQALGGRWEILNADQKGLHEANYLTIDSSKAIKHLKWMPRLSIDQAMGWTAAWYNEFLRDTDTTRIKDMTYKQIKEFLSDDHI
jgi:CDP-glucose 4,6-dehydratase